MLKQMKRAAVYCRLACEDETRIEQQKAEVMKCATEQGYKNIAVYVDNGVSGHDFNRPAFSNMQIDIDSGKIDAVFVKSICRLGRNAFDVRHWMCLMEKKGIKVIALNCLYEKDSDLFLNLNVVELLKESIRLERMKRGIKLSSGVINNGAQK